MELKSSEKDAFPAQSTFSNYHQFLVPVSVISVVFIFHTDGIKFLTYSKSAEVSELPKGPLEVGMNLTAAASLAVKKFVDIEAKEFYQVGAFTSALPTLKDSSDSKSELDVCFFTIARPEEFEFDVFSTSNNHHWLSAEEITRLDQVSQVQIKSAFLELKRRARFENLAFQFLNAEFSLSELQKVFESILEKTIDVRNFRKKIESLQILTESNNRPRGMAHRPPRLFQFDKAKYDHRLSQEGEVRFF